MATTGSGLLMASSTYGKLPCSSEGYLKQRGNFVGPRKRSMVVVRAETSGQTINPEIRKTEAKVVDSVVVTELSKPLTAYCR